MAHGTCPNCGHCDKCGRSNPKTFYPNPYWPNLYPNWSIQPPQWTFTTPTYTTSGNNTTISNITS